MIILHTWSPIVELQARQTETRRFLYDLRNSNPEIVVLDVATTGNTTYEQIFKTLWLSGQPFINIEHDIVPTNAQLYELIYCQHTYCAYGYYIHNQRLGAGPEPVLAQVDADGEAIKEGDESCQMPALGFVKFGAPRFPINWKEFWGREGMEPFYMILDYRLFILFKQQNIQWHMHWPIVKHNHLDGYQTTRIPR